MKNLACLSFSVFLLLLTACNEGSGVPVANTHDFRVFFTTASATDSCSDDIKTTVAGAAERTEIYRLHYPVNEETDRVDLYWKNLSDADEDFRFFAAGTLVPRDDESPGGLEDGDLNYAGGSFLATRTVSGGQCSESPELFTTMAACEEEGHEWQVGDDVTATVTFEVEGVARTEGEDHILNAHEEYIITKSTAPDAYPIGCVVTYDYTADLLPEQGADP